MLIPYNIKVGHRNQDNFKFLHIQLKNITSKCKQTHVVYIIFCNNCNGIGQTKQCLADCLKGYKSSSYITALKKYISNTNHSFNFENTHILMKEENYNARTVLEMY